MDSNKECPREHKNHAIGSHWLSANGLLCSGRWSLWPAAVRTNAGILSRVKKNYPIMKTEFYVVMLYSVKIARNEHGQKDRQNMCLCATQTQSYKNTYPTNFITIIILSCLKSLDSSKPIQKTISVNHEGLSTPITT